MDLITINMIAIKVNNCNNCTMFYNKWNCLVIYMNIWDRISIWPVFTLKSLIKLIPSDNKDQTQHWPIYPLFLHFTSINPYKYLWELNTSFCTVDSCVHLQWLEKVNIIMLIREYYPKQIYNYYYSMSVQHCNQIFLLICRPVWDIKHLPNLLNRARDLRTQPVPRSDWRCLLCWVVLSDLFQERCHHQ